MPDIKLTQGTDGTFDISVENGDLANEDGFDTAIWVSLLTDARAPESKVLRPENRRGWIGNTASLVENRDLGGLFWLVEQRRLTQDTLNETIGYVRQALAWFVEDGIAVNVAVSGEIVPRSGIRLAVSITSKEGVTETRYFNIWEVTGIAT